jgi:hypothetical protein
MLVREGKPEKENSPCPYGLEVIMFAFLVLAAIAAIAKLEEILIPCLLILEKDWLLHYKFKNENSLFCWLCRHIPAGCTAQEFAKRFGIKIPPLCQLNPLYDWLMCLQAKARCFNDQEAVIEQWASFLSPDESQGHDEAGAH